MCEVNVDDLKEGMVLANDLKDSKGRFLLGKGTTIDEKHIRVMKIWGITSAEIEGVSRETLVRESLQKIDPEILQEATTRVDSLFENTIESHAALEELKHQCVLRTAARIADGASLPGLEDIETECGEPPDETIVSIDELVEKKIKLSSFPDIYYQIVNVLNDSRGSAVRLADVVSKDPGLSTTLLKLVNSAFYGLPSRVDSIPRAIALIGGRELSTLAMGISVIRFFKDIPPDLVDMKKFWMHSIGCGVVARILANRMVDISEEQYFIGGLLHDVGRLILFMEFPRTAAYTIVLSRKRDIPVYRAEKEILGYDHAAVAGLCLKKWNFPASLIQMIRKHHEPVTARSSIEPSLVMVSDLIVKAMGYGAFEREVLQTFKPEVWEATGLSTSVLGPSIEQADRQIKEIFRAFQLNEV